MALTLTREEQAKYLNEAQKKWAEFQQARASHTGSSAREAAPHNFTAQNVITAKADATLVFVVIKGHLTAQLVFDNGQKMNFDAWPWGVGAGGGTGVGLYYGVSADALAGSCHYHCQYGGVGGGFIQFTCWRDGVGALGQINVFGVIEGAGETGGDDGNWTHA